MHQLSTLLQCNERWLMERILLYAKRQGYTKYTSTLVEAWRLSISGLTDALCMTLHVHGPTEPQFLPDEDYPSDPVTEFGKTEALRHRDRGISLSMFLGLLKYYRDSYVELIVEKGAEEYQHLWTRFVLRSFDRFEISLCAEWGNMSGLEHVERLENANRRLTNEKNKYLTFFESSPCSTFLVDKDGLLDSMNLAAAQLLGLEEVSDIMYYSGGHSTIDRKAEGRCVPFKTILPWLEGEMVAFSQGDGSTKRIEACTDVFGERRCFDVFLARMLDVSDKFTGVSVMLDDITQRKMLEEKLNYLATTDALTGVNNLHRFLELGEVEVSRAQRHGRPLSILMLDIDHFKRINDAYGHATGDDVLRALSGKCREMFRQGDVFGRIGGEEFAAILPDTSVAEAGVVAARLCGALAGLRISGPSGEISFTVSIGVAGYETGQKLADTLFNADKALYEAKDLGRNRVVIESTHGRIC